MAKDLPYFKFFVSEWNDGDITLEDYEVQGLFINLCSYYWSNECEMTFNKAEKKFKDAPEDLWQTLLESNIIKEVDGNLIISFLDEQQEERLKTSKIKSKGGKASAEARRLKKLELENNINLTEIQHVLNSCSTESQLLREEKIREDKIKEDKKREEEVFDIDIFYDVVELEKYYLSNEKIISSVMDSQNMKKEILVKKVKEFTKMLISSGRLKETFREYAKYFLSWNRTTKNKTTTFKPTKKNKGYV